MAKKKKNEHGERIAALLSQLNWRQVDLAKAASTDASTVSSLISGSRKLAAGMATRIASATGCSIDWLLDGIGGMFPTSSASASPYDETIADGATPLVAGIYARYLALSDEEKEIFDSILTRLFSASLHEQIEAFMKDGASRIAAAARSINQIGDNNNASIR